MINLWYVYCTNYMQACRCGALAQTISHRPAHKGQPDDNGFCLCLSQSATTYIYTTMGNIRRRRLRAGGGERRRMARRLVETSSRTEKIRAVRISKSMESLSPFIFAAPARAQARSPRGFFICHFSTKIYTMPSTFPRVLIFADSGSRSCRWLYGSFVHKIVRTGTSNVLVPAEVRVHNRFA